MHLPGRVSTGDGGPSLLCQKKDLIIEKFDELLKKLGGEELSANITMGKVTAEWKEAMKVSLIKNSMLHVAIAHASCNSQ